MLYLCRKRKSAFPAEANTLSKSARHATTIGVLVDVFLYVYIP